MSCCFSLQCVPLLSKEGSMDKGGKRHETWDVNVTYFIQVFLTLEEGWKTQNKVIGKC